MKFGYSVKAVCPNLYHIVDSKGFPVYDDAPHGKDTPLAYRDYDDAADAAERLNLANSGEEQEEIS